jgi:DNA mismatch repair protein MSH5
MYINSDALLYVHTAFSTSSSSLILWQCFRSLQIFDTESHASIQSNQTKEGLSLFGILNNTRTYLGRGLLYQWMLRPSTSMSVIGARHEAISCFLRADNIGVSDAMHGHIKGLGNIARAIHMLKMGKGGLREWQALVKVRLGSLI